MLKPNYVMNAIVLRVIDGDTIEVECQFPFYVKLTRVMLRLRDVFAPELHSRDEATRAKAVEAKEFVRSLCPEGSKIVVQSFVASSGYYRKTFDRFVADVQYIDPVTGQDLSLNMAIVSAGHATATPVVG